MKILLAVDGSDPSYEALRTIKYLRRAEELLLVHVVAPLTPGESMTMPIVYQQLYENLERRRCEEGARLLDHMVSLLPLDSGPVTKHVVSGSPTEQIAELVRLHHVDLVVMGTRGLGPIRERLLGSVAHGVLTGTPAAKFMVPSPVKAIEQVLVALFDAQDAEQAVHFLQQMPFRQVGDLTLFTALPEITPLWPAQAAAFTEMETHIVKQAEDLLTATATRLTALGYRTKTKVAFGAPVDSILNDAATRQAHLVMLGSRGRHGLTRMLLGSVTHALLHQATYPLLVFN